MHFVMGILGSGDISKVHSSNVIAMDFDNEIGNRFLDEM
jgi:hypothetical protein